MKKDRKIFLPLTLDSSTKTAFSGKQLFGFFFFGLVFFLLQLLILKIRDLPAIAFAPWLNPVTIIAEILLTYFIIFLIRKIVIKEDKIMQNYQTNQDLQKTELDFMWDIFAVKDGRIRYCSSGREAIIIRLTHGYLLDRPVDQEQVHRDSINTAIGTLCKQGYKFIYFNRETKDPNLGPLAATQRKMTKYKVFSSLLLFIAIMIIIVNISSFFKYEQLKKNRKILILSFYLFFIIYLIMLLFFL